MRNRKKVRLFDRCDFRCLNKDFLPGKTIICEARLQPFSLLLGSPRSVKLETPVLQRTAVSFFPSLADVIQNYVPGSPIRGHVPSFLLSSKAFAPDAVRALNVQGTRKLMGQSRERRKAFSSLQSRTWRESRRRENRGNNSKCAEVMGWEGWPD